MLQSCIAQPESAVRIVRRGVQVNLVIGEIRRSLVNPPSPEDVQTTDAGKDVPDTSNAPFHGTVAEMRRERHRALVFVAHAEVFALVIAVDPARTAGLGRRS